MLYFDNVRFLNVEYLFTRVFDILGNLPSYFYYAFFFWTELLGSFWLKVFFWCVTVFFGGIVFYSLFKIWEINKKEWQKYLALFAVKDGAEKEKREIDQRWVDILGHLESENAPNWTIAILECDKILDELLRERGYSGEGIGEMLKSIPADKMRTLQDAWEAHKIRNRIAHEAGYVLEKREARMAVSLYEAVFREFGFLD